MWGKEKKRKKREGGKEKQKYEKRTVWKGR
jgi:hypothetical protein